jgi:hypothetical protein
MRIGVLLLAAICVLAPGGARGGEATWVFQVDVSYQDHFCVHTWGYHPGDVDVPWEDVAYGRFEFLLQHEGGFLSPDPVPCTATYGSHEVERFTFVYEQCPDWLECYLHGLQVSGTFTVAYPTSAQDFTVYLDSEWCGDACGSYNGCEPYGNLFGTLYLYAEPTSTASTSWSTIKASY